MLKEGLVCDFVAFLNSGVIRHFHIKDGNEITCDITLHNNFITDFKSLTQNIPTNYLSIPLDVHSGNVARKLGLLTRKQNDAKALIELDLKLREFDPEDPVKYDYALFGLGAFEAF